MKKDEGLNRLIKIVEETLPEDLEDVLIKELEENPYVWICQGCGAKDSVNSKGICRIVTCGHGNVLGG